MKQQLSAITGIEISLVHEAAAAILPVGRLRFVALSYVDSDECGC